MSTFTIRSFDQIMADMTAYILANAPQITDLTPGSILRSFCEASAMSIEELYVSVYLGFTRALQTVAPNIFNFPMQTGTYASATVVFLASPAPSSAITIPIGTQVQTSAGLVYTTTSQGTIASSETVSNLVGVTANVVGAVYNVASGAINTMLTNVNGVSGVSNNATDYSGTTPAVGGTDAESEQSYQARFQSYIQGLAGSNLAGITTAALSVSGITSCSIVEEFPPITVGGIPNVNAAVYVDNGSPTGTPASLVAQVQSVINGNGTSSSPGYRSAGVNVVAFAPAVVDQNFTLTITTTNDNVNTTTLQNDVIAAITNYVNTLGVGDTIIFAEVIASVMSVFGVANVAFSEPTGDVTIPASEVGRTGTISVSVG